MIIPRFALIRKNSFHRHMIVTVIGLAVDGWAAGTTEMGRNGCEWIGIGANRCKIPLDLQSRWKSRGFRRFGQDVLDKKRDSLSTVSLVGEAGLEAVLCQPLCLRSTGQDRRFCVFRRPFADLTAKKRCCKSCKEQTPCGFSVYRFSGFVPRLVTLRNPYTVRLYRGILFSRHRKPGNQSSVPPLSQQREEHGHGFRESC